MKVPPDPSAVEIAQSFDCLSRYLGARITLRADRSTDIVIPAAEHALDSDGRHGELALMCGIDIATGMASSMASESTGATLTTDMSIDLLDRPAPGELRTVGRVLKVGKRVIVNEAVVTDRTGRTVAFATVGCSPVGDIRSDLQTGGFLPDRTIDLASPELAGQPIGQAYNTSPPDGGFGDAPAPLASIALNSMTANPFGFLHGAVGAYLFLSGARRAGVKQPGSLTVRYLRPTTHGPADVLVDDVFGNGGMTGVKLSLRDRATTKVACVAHVAGVSR